MRRRILLGALAGAVLFAVVSAILFVKTVYLPARVGAMIDTRLSSLPVKVSYDISSVSVLPPAIYFNTVSVAAPRGEGVLLSLGDCSVSGLRSLLQGKEKALEAVCERGTVDPRKAVDVLLATKDDDGKGPPRPDIVKKPPSLSLAVGSLSVIVDDRRLEVDLSADLRGDALNASVRPKGGEQDSFVLLSGSRSNRRLSAVFNRFPAEPYLRPWLPDERTYARALLDGTADLSNENEQAVLSLDLSFSDIAISHPFLDVEPFSLPLLRVYGLVSVDVAQKKAFFNDLVFSPGGMEVHAHGTLAERRFDLSVDMKDLPLNLLATLVKNRLFEGFLMDGKISVSLTAAGELLPGDVAFEAISIAGALEGAKQLSDRFDRYRSGFDYFFTDDSGAAFRVEVKNSKFTYAPLALLPSYVPRAVVLSEDAGFFLHHGIDLAEMDAAFKDNLTRHELRGGSTITQQLVKNLFLTRNKTLLRKFRELLLAVELDATLSKERILEIYLNVIEWGPGIFGIGQAAQHYFGKLPEELLPHEAAWLATIIPNPKRFYHEYRNGSVSETRQGRIQRLLDLLFESGHISGDLYIACYTAPLIFRSETEGEGGGW